jgi:hypothetical protein
MKKAVNDRRTRTAHHEAGHAVAAILKGRRFKYVTTIPDDAMGSLGHVQFRIMRAFRPDEASAGCWALDDGRKAKRLDDEVCIQVAGMAAEAIYTGRRNWRGAHGDYHAAVGLASYRCNGCDGAITAYLKWQAEEAKSLLTRTAVHRKCVEAVAERLIEENRLEEGTVRKIVFGLLRVPAPRSAYAHRRARAL